MSQVNDDGIVGQIESDLLEISRSSGGISPGAWVKCHVVVIEDIDTHPEGINAVFVAVPRVGEYVSGFGVVEEVTHGPTLPDGSSLPYPYVTLYVRRNARDAHRT